MNKLSCHNLDKSYDYNDDSLQVLKNINISIDQGTRIAITGPSGSGKSTLLHILAGLDIPTTGKVIFNNKDLHLMSNKQISSLRLNNFGFVYQQHHLLSDLTVEENIMMPGLLNNFNKDEIKADANKILRKLGLFDRKNHLPWKLSGGEKQRTAIARALINKPSFIFLDEPTGNLDKNNAEIIQSLLFDMSESFDVALICATHDNEFIEMFTKEYKLEKFIPIKK